MLAGAEGSEREVGLRFWGMRVGIMEVCYGWLLVKVELKGQGPGGF
jgi:hypothetical protein